MPHSKHPLSYPINRLFLNVGMSLGSWIQRLPRALTPEEKREREQLIIGSLGLDRALHDGLILWFRFEWSNDGRIINIRLTPHERVRRTPGIRRIKELFFPASRGKSHPLRSYYGVEDPDSGPYLAVPYWLRKN